MRIIKLKDGTEREITEKLFNQIKPYLEGGRNGAFKLRGERIEIWNIDNYSDSVDDSFMSQVEAGTNYVLQNTKPKQLYLQGRKINEDEWREIQEKKLDWFVNPPKSDDYPPVNTTDPKTGVIRVVDRYKQVLWLFKQTTPEKRLEMIKKAKGLLDRYKMDASAAGKAYALAWVLEKKKAGSKSGASFRKENG